MADLFDSNPAGFSTADHSIFNPHGALSDAHTVSSRVRHTEAWLVGAYSAADLPAPVCETADRASAFLAALGNPLPVHAVRQITDAVCAGTKTAPKLAAEARDLLLASSLGMIATDGGGIPVIATLRESLQHRIEADLYGLVGDAVDDLAPAFGAAVAKLREAASKLPEGDTPMDPATAAGGGRESAAAFHDASEALQALAALTPKAPVSRVEGAFSIAETVLIRDEAAEGVAPIESMTHRSADDLLVKVARGNYEGWVFALSGP